MIIVLVVFSGRNKQNRSQNWQVFSGTIEDAKANACDNFEMIAEVKSCPPDQVLQTLNGDDASLKILKSKFGLQQLLKCNYPDSTYQQMNLSEL
jgi:nickel-dependent lactate racemase